MPKVTPHPLLREVGDLIRAARASAGMSQEALAAAADIDRSYMSGIERGLRNITVVKLAAIAEALNVELRVLLPSRQEVISRR